MSIPTGASRSFASCTFLVWHGIDEYGREGKRIRSRLLIVCKAGACLQHKRPLSSQFPQQQIEFELPHIRLRGHHNKVEVYLSVPNPVLTVQRRFYYARVSEACTLGCWVLMLELTI